MSEPRRKDLKQLPFELQKLSANLCLEPSEACSFAAIRAHSIQNTRVLDRLCSKGHVIMPKRQNPSDGRVDIVAFESIGRHRATTFTGLCGKHDRLIFEPIDKSPIDIRNGEHLFLVAYRSVLRELHATLSGAARSSFGSDSERRSNSASLGRTCLLRMA